MAPVEHICQNPYLPEHRFPHRNSGGNKYCSRECYREVSQKASAAGRRARTRLDQHSRRDFLLEAWPTLVVGALRLLESLPEKGTPRQEVIWLELRQIDDLFTKQGPLAVADRRDIRLRAGAVAEVFRQKPPRDERERMLEIAAFESLRDAG